MSADRRLEFSAPPRRLTASDALIAGFRRRVAGVLIARQALWLCAAWLFVWGVAVVIARVVGVERSVLLWGLAGLPMMVLVGAAWGWRRRPGAAAARAALDAHNSAGGLLMVDDDPAAESWHDRLPALRLPALRWRGRRSWAMLGIAAAFVLAGMLVPVRGRAASAPRTLNISQPVARLVSQIDTLEREKILDPKQTAAMREQLSQVREQARADRPARTWEALDHVSAEAHSKAAKAGEEAIRRISQLADAQSLSEALEQSGDQLTGAQRAAAMSKLSRMVDRAAAENAEVKRHLDPALREAMKAGRLSKAQRKALKRALSGGRKMLSGKLARLHKAGLLRESDLRLARRMGKTHGKALAAYLASHPGTGGLDEAMAWSRTTAAGSGGVSRGGGPVPMTFNVRPTSDDGAKFDPHALPPAALQALRKSKLVGVTSRAPKADAEAPGSSGAALSHAAAAGGSAAQQVVLPRYRSAVREYFNRD